MRADVENGRAVIVGSGTGLSDNPAQLNVNFPMSVDIENGRVTMDVDAAATGSLVWRGDLESLWRLLPVDDHIVDGTVELNASFDGTLASPQITGGFRLSGGAYEYLPAGTILRNLDLDLRAENTETFQFSLSANDRNQGVVRAAGEVGRSAVGEPWEADIRATLDRISLVNRDDVTLGATGELAYAGPLLAGTLGGELQVVRSTIRLDATYAPDIPLLRETPVSSGFTVDGYDDQATIGLNVMLDVEELLRAEGRGLESFWRGRLFVGGDIDQPELAGSITLDRGTFTFLGQTFTLDSGTITFTGGGDIDPA
ncbi:MAG: translocation/assembly module TamB domain-containing protein, partial [Rhodospirillaceae bacterium]